jgi:hypothetical protein
MMSIDQIFVEIIFQGYVNSTILPFLDSLLDVVTDFYLFQEDCIAVILQEIHVHISRVFDKIKIVTREPCR